MVRQGYKQTEIGEIPEDWEVVHLGEKGFFKKGKGIKKDEIIDNGISCIRYGEIYTQYNNFTEKLKSYIPIEISKQSQPIKKGDLLFAGSGETAEEIGKCVAYTGSELAFAGGDIIIFTPNEGDSKYLGYLMNNEIIVNQKSRMGQGDAVVHIYSSHIKDVFLPFPDTKEQSTISQVLSYTDNLIEKLDKLIEKKKNIKQGAMQELLTGKKRLPGFDGEWEVNILKKMVQTPITDGPHMTPKFISKGVPFLSVNNLVNNKIDLTDLRFISKEDDIIFSKKCKPKENDILIGKAASVGMVGIVEFDLDFNIWSPLALVRLKLDYSPKYVYYSFQTSSLLNQIKLLTNSSSQGNIGMGDIEKLEFKIPSNSKEQQAIAQILSDMDAEIDELERKRDKYKLLKLGMMQQLLTGKIRLPWKN